VDYARESTASCGFYGLAGTPHQGGIDSSVAAKNSPVRFEALGLRRRHATETLRPARVLTHPVLRLAPATEQGCHRWPMGRIGGLQRCEIGAARDDLHHTRPKSFPGSIQGHVVRRPAHPTVDLLIVHPISRLLASAHPIATA
jgi:hypothetical protein